MNIVGQLCEETMKIEEYNSSWLRVLTATATIRFCHADGISPVPTVVVWHMFTLFMFAFSYFSIIVARCWSRPWSQKDEILPSQLYTVHAIHPYSMSDEQPQSPTQPAAASTTIWKLPDGIEDQLTTGACLLLHHSYCDLREDDSCFCNGSLTLYYWSIIVLFRPVKDRRWSRRGRLGGCGALSIRKGIPSGLDSCGHGRGLGLDLWANEIN